MRTGFIFTAFLLAPCAIAPEPAPAVPDAKDASETPEPPHPPCGRAELDGAAF